MINKVKSNDAFSAVSFVDMTQHQHGQRIDNFLFSHLKGVPKSRVYRILRKGEVRVNKGRVKPEYKLQAGDRLRLPPIRVAQTQEVPQYFPDWVKQALQNPVFEDEDLMVLNKPAGLAVHGGSGLDYGLIEALRSLRPELPFIELVHRIDRETSGFLLLAKSRPSLNALHQQFRRNEGRVEKAYLAVLLGELNAVKPFSAYLRQYQDEKGMKRVRLLEKSEAGAQFSKSTFMPLSHNNGVSFSRILLFTGRMHQARVHAASLDLPILGDKLYGNWAANRDAKKKGVSRCMLHAERYQFTHPSSGEQMQFKIPLPGDFETVLQNYGLGLGEGELE